MGMRVDSDTWFSQVEIVYYNNVCHGVKNCTIAQYHYNKAREREWPTHYTVGKKLSEILLSVSILPVTGLTQPPL